MKAIHMIHWSKIGQLPQARQATRIHTTCNIYATSKQVTNNEAQVTCGNCLKRATPRVMALDPGGTTGCALLNERTIYLQQWRGGNEHSMVELICDHYWIESPEVLIMERFVPHPGATYTWQSLSAMRIGFAVEHLLLGGCEVVWQTPSEMGTMTDDRLKHWGYWKKGKPHAMDALRHLLVWMRKNANDTKGLRVEL